MPAFDTWTTAYGYIHQFYQVSHPYMAPDVVRAPLRLAHQEILKDKQSKDDHAQDLLSVYHCIDQEAIGLLGGKGGKICGLYSKDNEALKFWDWSLDNLGFL